MNPDATDASGNSTRPTPGYLVLRPPVRATQQETATSRKIEAKLSGKAGVDHSVDGCLGPTTVRVIARFSVSTPTADDTLNVYSARTWL